MSLMGYGRCTPEGIGGELQTALQQFASHGGAREAKAVGRWLCAVVAGHMPNGKPYSTQQYQRIGTALDELLCALTGERAA